MEHTPSTIPPDRRIDEAHGLWELQVARLAALVEGGADRRKLQAASRQERDAFRNWQTVSQRVGA